MANTNSGILRFGGSSNSDAEDYTTVTKFEYQELAAATNNFAPESLLGEGKYGRTFRGCLKSSGQVVAVRQVNARIISSVYRYPDQPMSSTNHLRSLLHHPNIVDMIGYSIDGDQIFFPLDWNSRMKIAAGAAKGLKYLHDKSNPPVIHGNIKPSNILLCEGYQSKLSDFLGFKERIPDSDESNHARFFSSQCYLHAPEFYISFELTQQSDIYNSSLRNYQLIKLIVCLVSVQAKRKLVGGKEFTTVADPLLKGHYPEQGLYQALSLAAECLQSKDVSRPRIGDVVNVLSNLASEIYDPNATQINRAGTLTIGSFEKEGLTEQWRHLWSFST
ncbi:hypothetical protein MKX01_023491 [Papaver californicum]|nr:hypothetical protein MKX01_023491 [Papaver californicum]